MAFSYLSSKKRVLYLNGQNRLSPWSELGQVPPDGTFIEGWPLHEIHSWQSHSEGEPVELILVDIDVIAATVPLDKWAFRAWKSSLNELIARCTHPDGRSPLLIAYTREPTWERAMVAVKIGARDVTKFSKLNEKIRETLAGPTPRENAPVEDVDAEAPADTGKVLKLTPRERETPALPVAPHAPIPKHAIPFPIEGLEGTSTAIEAVRELIRKTSPLDTSVLITGATGSGKERVARSIHRYSGRALGPFIAVNCGALASGVVESELFGHVKGAFTGAHDDRMGWLQAAHTGTLFLDEVSELSPEAQVKLLRALQERRVTPVGSATSVAIDIRVVAATKLDVDDLVEQGRFREDLLYRLRVMEIALPSLRERKADIPGLAKTILSKLAKRHKRSLLMLQENVVEKLLLYAWPGNIRELENSLEHAATLAWAEGRKHIEVKNLPESVQFATMSSEKDQVLKDAVRNFEKEYIAATIRRLGSKEDAAEALGLSLATLYRKIGS